MPYTAVPFRSFGAGLNLRDQPDVVSEAEAIDILNCTFTERGAVKQRDGYTKFTPSELTNRPDSLGRFYKVDGTRRLVVGNGNRLDVLDTTGASVANSTAPTASPHFFTRFGGPTIEAVYIANGTDQIRRYDTAGGFTAPAGLSGQTGRFLSISPNSNRLVVARESGTTGGNNPSSVNFSDAGAPETFTANNYVDLDPGDGESIMGIARFGASILVFKETKFYEFFSESTDNTGQPQFNYRRVDMGVGLASSRALCVGRDGVYFMDRRGVYRTQGGPPQLISDVIEPFFQGGASIYYKSNTLNHAQITLSAMAWHDERLYVAVPTGTQTYNDRLLVFDPRYGWWSLWNIPASALTSFRISDQAELVFGYSTGPKLIGRHSSAYTSDVASYDYENLITNPSFEVDTTGWTNTSLTTMARDTTRSKYGSASLKCVSDAAADRTRWTTGALTSGQQYTFAIWVYLESSTTDYLFLQATDNSGAGPGIFTDASTGQIGTTGSWQRLYVTFTATSSTIHFLSVRQNGAGDATWYVDGALCVAGPVMDYFDGSLSTAYWTGTANASTSRRFLPSMTSRWRSGWQDYGNPNVKTIRESRLWGYGGLSVLITKDFDDVGGTPQPLTLTASGTDVWTADASDVWTSDPTDVWGPSGTTRPKAVRYAARGTVFSTGFQNSTPNATWGVNRLDHHLRETRVPSVVETERV